MSALAEERRFDPANDTHYAISGWNEYQLRRVAQAMEAVGNLLDGVDAERTELGEKTIGAIFHAFSYAIAGATAQRAVVIPKRRGK